MDLISNTTENCMSDDSFSTCISHSSEDLLVSKHKPKKKSNEITQERKEKAIKAMNYLLKNSQRFSDYFVEKLKPQSNQTKQIIGNLPEIEHMDAKHKEKNSNLIQLEYFEGTLLNYQVEGLNWLKLLFENAINGILADEMGLGKTIQIIALICHLIENKIPGPYLIVAPLSTLTNWICEFKKFAPEIPVILFHGSVDERVQKQIEIQKKYHVKDFSTYPVVVTSYQYPIMQEKFLQKFNWQYLIIDEGHNIKNYRCKLTQALKKLKSENRLILSGTPLQNNLLELWSLLNFLLPQTFSDAETFEALFEVEDCQETEKILQQEQTTNIISTIHGVLAPFMLRRLKVDVLKENVPKKEMLVYCPLSDMQRELYKNVLQRNVDQLMGKKIEENSSQESKKRKCTFKHSSYSEFSQESSENSENMNSSNNSAENEQNFVYRVHLSNPMMLMKKIVNHPFTVHCPVDNEKKNVVIDESVVKQSGKMMVLDAMLARLKAGGHKVLIFCTMTSILDFIEDYICLRDYKYCRLDGRCKTLKERQFQIDSFNNNPDIFVFLISTRAGGLGLNLSAADTVIFYDRDWNPQVDIQAQDRCHRIGQKRPVMIYSLIAKGTIDESIIARANAKRKLEAIVIKRGKCCSLENNFKSVLDLEELEKLLNSVDHQIILTNESVFTEEELNTLLDRTELYKQMEEREKSL